MRKFTEVDKHDVSIGCQRQREVIHFGGGYWDACCRSGQLLLGREGEVRSSLKYHSHVVIDLIPKPQRSSSPLRRKKIASSWRFDSNRRAESASSEKCPRGRNLPLQPSSAMGLQLTDLHAVDVTAAS